MPFYERGPVRIHYEEVGSGFPLLLIPGGGLNSSFASWETASPFKPMERYKDDFRCVCADLRNANPGQSSGPLEIDRPWDAYTDDQLGLMDHRHPRVHGHGLLHRRADDPQPDQAGGGPRRRGRDDATQRLQARDPRPFLPEQHQGLGAAALREAPRPHDGHGPRLPHQHVHQPRRLRLHRVARFRALHQDAAADRARRRARAPVQGRDGGGQPRPEGRGDHLSLERFAGAHRRGRGARAALPQGPRGTMNWLVKEEPSHYGFDALVKDKKAAWSGVRNALAQKHLRAIEKGDRIFYYHTGDEKAVVGIAKALSAAYPDPEDASGKYVAVDVAPVKRLPRPVSLAEIKADAAFKDFPLVRIARLSVMPVSDAEWTRIERMAGKAG